jgi:single-stranded DNA-binding protein
MNRNYTGRRWRLASLLILAAMVWGALLPLPAAAADPAWRGEYYPNRWLAGAPIVVRDDAAINFDWGQGSPHPYIPPDGFSARWTRSVNFDAGKYRFTVQADDGIRLFVDGVLVINQWQDQAASTFSVERTLSAGDHALRVEYYENTGGAMARVSWVRVDAPPPPEGVWRGEYFSNPWLSGAPTFVRDDPRIDFNWAWGSPDPRIPPDNFSTRWTRTATFEGGRHRFTIVIDDGARLYLDGRLVIDAWRQQAATAYRVEMDLAAGTHSLRMEYFEDAGEAVARLSWERISGGQPPPPAGDWRGEYFSNRSLAGSPALLRNDAQVRFDWGAGSPAPQIPSNDFSVRWTRTVGFEAARYRFTTVTDDGVRLFIDGRLVMDRWQDMGNERHWVDVQLTAGNHQLRLEYYEHTGNAAAQLTWEKQTTPPRDVGNIVTCARPTNSWVRIYRLDSGRWTDTNPRGYSPVSASGFMKLDGMLVDTVLYGSQGNPSWVELWADGRVIRSVGNTGRGEPPFRVKAFVDNATPWGCPAP